METVMSQLLSEFNHNTSGSPVAIKEDRVNQGIQKINHQWVLANDKDYE